MSHTEGKRLDRVIWLRTADMHRQVKLLKEPVI